MPNWDTFMLKNRSSENPVDMMARSHTSSSSSANLINTASHLHQSKILTTKEDFDYLEYSPLPDHSNLSLTLQNIRSLLNPENYPPSFKATLTRRTTLIIAFYCSIVIVSMFGNLLVCYVVFKRKRMRISTNLLMTNLALSDLLMTVINIPFNIARILLDEWPFGSILCILVPLVQVTSVYVSTLTMTIIAIDRYQAIINPLHKRITTSLPTLLTILLIWIAAAIFSIPNVIFNRVVEIAGHTNLHRCRAIYPKPELLYRRHVTLFTFLTQYAIPLSITTFAYIRISFYIWSKLTNDTKNNGQQDDPNDSLAAGNRSNDSMENSVPSIIPPGNHKAGISFKTNGHNPGNCYQASINQLRERSRRKSIKMLALVVGVFSICWLPLNIFHLNSDFSSNNRISDPNIFFICHWFAMSSVCYNPFIYFWLNRHYRQEIKHLIRCTNLFVFFSSNRHHHQHNNPASSPVMDVMNNNNNNQNPTNQPLGKHRNHHHHHSFDSHNKNHPMVCFENIVDSKSGYTPKTIIANGHAYHHHNNSNNNSVILTGNQQQQQSQSYASDSQTTPTKTLSKLCHHHHHQHNNSNNNVNCKVIFRTRFPVISASGSSAPQTAASVIAPAPNIEPSTIATAATTTTSPPTTICNGHYFHNIENQSPSSIALTTTTTNPLIRCSNMPVIF